MTRGLAPILLVMFTAVTGTQTSQGSVSGVVFANDANGPPLARAVVTLASPSVRPSLVAIADAVGRFTFTDVPAGLFTLTASKARYLTMAYGQTAPGHGAGLPIAIAAGQQVTDLKWALPKGGAVSGRVLNERGQPMRDVPIVLMQYSTLNGEKSLGPVSCCVWPTSGSDGTYRVYGVAPGDYLVSAIPPGNYVFIPSGPWSGNNREVRQVDPAEMRWALQQVGGAGTAGAAPPAANATEPPAGPTVSYGRIYFPDAMDDRAAATVTIGRGEERGGIDFKMRLFPTARIEGRIVDPAGQPAMNARVTMGGATSGGLNPTFSYRNLLPGHYVITAHAGSGTQYGTAEIDLNGQDVTDLVLRLDPAPTISGQVVFESATPPASPPMARLSLRPMPPGLTPMTAASDGHFKLPIDPGTFRLTAVVPAPAAGRGGDAAAAAGPAWTLKSITWNGRDIVDAAFDVARGGALTDIVVTFTDRPTELSGTLFGADGQPAPGYYVAVFPTDRALWTPGSRRVPAPARAATNGTFRFVGLPPGSYLMVALTSVDAADLADAAFLEQLARSGVTVTLAEGEKKVSDLKFAR